MRNLASTIAFSLALTLAPGVRASGAERGAPSTSRVEDGPAAAQGPEIELRALDDTLNYSVRTFARPDDAPAATARSGAERTRRSAAEAELDALAADPLTEPSGHAPMYAGSPWSGEAGGVVSAPEAELHALLAWQDAGNATGRAFEIDLGAVAKCEGGDAKNGTAQRGLATSTRDCT